MGKFLGLINIHGLTRRLPESDRLARRDISTKWDQQKRADIFFIKVRPFLCDNKCRKPTPNLVNLKCLGIELYKNKWLCEEQDALGQSMQALRGEEMIHSLVLVNTESAYIFQSINWLLSAMSLAIVIEILVQSRATKTD